MTINVAINGYGRIGRNILRALYESDKRNTIKIVAINNLGNLNSVAHLTEYDTTHGRFNADIRVTDNTLMINGDEIQVFAERDPANLPWGELDIDVVFECTGVFATKEKASVHIASGAKKVIISAPAGKEVDATIVYGVNHHTLSKNDVIISNASCTTNCLAPLAQVLDETIGIAQGLMTTIHAYTNDQVLTDSYHADLRRARSATHSMIPTKTGAASAVGLVLPSLAGKLDGLAVRVPTLNVSLVDLTFTAKRATTIDEINTLMDNAANGDMKGILAVNKAPLVSIDFNHHTASSVYDATQTKVIGQLVKVLSWYDNEWGFSHRMLDTACALMAKA